MLDIFEAASIAAGRAIMAIRDRGPNHRMKADCSPVTEADEAAEAIILKALEAHFPDIACVAEEATAAGIAPQSLGERFFLIDPLDGTKEYVAGRDDFTVNIALIENAQPVAGFVYAPALRVAYAGDHRAGGSITEKLTLSDNFEVLERRSIACRSAQSPPVAVASRSHRTPETDAYLSQCGAIDSRSIGSSLKFCLLAEGLADVYPRFSRTMEWDTAAGDAILRAAGGQTMCLDGTPLTYGKRNQPHDSDFANPSFISQGAPSGHS